METDLEMESPLNNNYHPHSRRGQSVKTTSRSLVVSVLAGLSLPILLPSGHMLLFAHFWGYGDNEVDKKECTCSCWDTVFKGPYESGIAKYKHVYFNSTSNTFKMWVTSLLFFIALYETVKHLVLLLYKRRLRWSLGLLLLVSIHSHYYAWWGHWNYWNDDFYPQWSHQLFFTVTELFSSLLVFSQVDRRKAMEPLPLLIVGTIAIFHITSSTWDQFFLNVLKFGGRMHQVLRDILLMTTDCLQVFVVWRELRQIAGRKGVSLCHLVAQRRHLGVIGVTTAVMFLYLVLCP